MRTRLLEQLCGRGRFRPLARPGTAAAGGLKTCRLRKNMPPRKTHAALRLDTSGMHLPDGSAAHESRLDGDIDGLVDVGHVCLFQFELEFTNGFPGGSDWVFQVRGTDGAILTDAAAVRYWDGAQPAVSDSDLVPRLKAVRGVDG